MVEFQIMTLNLYTEAILFSRSIYRKTHKFEWTDKCENDFEDLKKHLTNMSILVKPDPVAGQEVEDSLVINRACHELRYSKIREYKQKTRVLCESLFERCRGQSLGGRKSWL